MTHRPRLFAVALAATIFTAGTAFAEATPEGAAAIREGLQSWIDQQLADAGASSDVRFDGELTVTPEGDAYQALIPPIEATLEGSVLRFDAVPVEIVPRPDGWYDASWRLPEAVVLNAGVEEGRLTIGEQRAAGVFAPEVGSFMSLDVEALDVAVLPKDAALGGVTLDRLVFDYSYEETSPGTYDQPGRVVMEGLTFDQPSAGQHFRAGRMEFGMTSTGLVLAEWAAFMDRFDAITTAATSGAAGDAEMADMMADLLAETDAFLSGVEVSYELSDIVLETPDVNLTLPSFSMGGYAEGLTAPLAEIGFALDLPGFTADMPVPDPYQHLIPTIARIDMALIDVPTDPLNRVVVEWLRGTSASGGDPWLMLDAVEDLLASESGRLELTEIAVANAISEASLHGELHPAPDSVIGVTGFGAMTITNLDELMNEVRASGAGPEAEAALTFLRGLGRPTSTPEGEIVQTYDWEVTPDGQVLVNGSDLMAYGMMGESTAPPAQETTPPAANPKLPTAPSDAPAAPSGVSKTPSAPVGPPAVAPGLK